MNHIGENISKLRQNKHMTQEEFAARLGVTPQAVSRWERGNSLPDISLMKGICEVLSVSADVLLEIEEGTKVVENYDIGMEKEIRSHLFAEPLVLEFGSSFISSVSEGLQTNYLNIRRKELVQECGILIPMLRLRDNAAFGEKEVQISAYDKVLWKGTMEITETVYQEMIDQVAQICRENYKQIINKQCVKVLIDCLKVDYPGIVDGLIPEKVSYLQVERRLQKIVEETGNIRDLIHILEEMEEESF